MGGRGLTHKQQKFVEFLVAGCTKVEAFRRAYPSDRRSKGTEWEGAKRVARLPKVIEAVQRSTLLHSQHDVAAQVEHITARLLELTKDPDPAVALRAIAQWAKLSEGGLLKPRPAVSETEKALVDELIAAVYNKPSVEAQSEAAPLRSLTPEEQEESTVQVIDVESEELASSLPVRSLLPATGQDRPDPPVPPETPERAAMKTDTCEWRLESVPGFFPRRLKRVRVR
jgi:hypothetical protein